MHLRKQMLSHMVVPVCLWKSKLRWAKNKSIFFFCREHYSVHVIVSPRPIGRKWHVELINLICTTPGTSGSTLGFRIQKAKRRMASHGWWRRVDRECRKWLHICFVIWSHIIMSWVSVKDLARGYVSSSNYGKGALVFQAVTLKLMTFVSQLFHLATWCLISRGFVFLFVCFVNTNVTPKRAEYNAW